MRDPGVVLKALSQLLGDVPQQKSVAKTEMRSIRRRSSQAKYNLVDEVDDGFGVRLNDLRRKNTKS